MNIVIVGDSRVPGIGRTLQLNVIATFSDGAQQDRSAAASWSSSNPAVATVTAGLVTAVGNGTADIQATYQGASLKKSIRVEVPLPADPSVTASVTVETSPDSASQWRAHLRVTYREQRGSSGFRVDAAHIDYRDASNRSLFIRDLGPGDFQQAWGSNRVEAGQSQVLARQLDFTGTTSTVVVTITTTMTDDLGNSVTLTTSATGQSARSITRDPAAREPGFSEHPDR